MERVERGQNFILAVKLTAAMLFFLFVVVYVVYPWVVPTPETSPALSAYSDGTYDMSRFRESLGSEFTTESVVSTALALNPGDRPGSTVLVSAGVERAYSARELASITEFVDRGGKLVLADDFGFGQQVSDALSERLSGRGWFRVDFHLKEVWSERYVKNPDFPVVNASLRDNRTGNLVRYTLLLNRPTGLSVEGNVTGIMAFSGNSSYIDLNENGKGDIGERYAFPMIVEGRVGNGSVIYISDASIFTNQLWEPEGDFAGFENRVFAEDLIKYLLPDGGRVVFDESRHVQDTGRMVHYGTYGLIINITTDPVFMLFIIVVILLVFVAALFATQQKQWLHRFSLSGFRGSGGPVPTVEELDARIRKALSAMGGKFEHQLSQDRELSDYMSGKSSLTEAELIRVLDRINGLMKVMRY